jgi:hypothetical protein
MKHLLESLYLSIASIVEIDMVDVDEQEDEKAGTLGYISARTMGAIERYDLPS